MAAALKFPVIDEDNCEDCYFAITPAISVVDDLLSEPMPLRLVSVDQGETAREIIDRVAGYLNVSSADIYGKKKTQCVSFARQVSMYLVREMTSLSLHGMADIFNKHHSSIVHAHKHVIGKRMAERPVFRAQIEQLRDSL